MSEPDLLPIVEVPIACSLGAQDLDARLGEWRRLLAAVTGTATGEQSGELVLHFHADTSVADLAKLCAAEVTCCPFFTFHLGIGADAVTLRVTVPPGAEAMLVDLTDLLPEGARASTAGSR